MSKVKYDILVQRCVRHPEEKGMCQVLGHAGRLFLHEDLWDRWSRGPSFAMKMSDGAHVRETRSELCRRSQSTLCLPMKASCVKPISESAIEELSVCCCNEDGQARDHVRNVVMNVSGGLKRENDSVKTIRSYEVGGVGKESNVMNRDEYTDEVQCVVCRISTVELDPILLRESRRTEIDFMNQLEMHWKRPKRWALINPRHSNEKGG